jgi:hypothetical protein
MAPHEHPEDFMKIYYESDGWVFDDERVQDERPPQTPRARVDVGLAVAVGVCSIAIASSVAYGVISIVVSLTR